MAAGEGATGGKRLGRGRGVIRSPGSVWRSGAEDRTLAHSSWRGGGRTRPVADRAAPVGSSRLAAGALSESRGVSCPGSPRPPSALKRPPLLARVLAPGTVLLGRASLHLGAGGSALGLGWMRREEEAKPGTESPRTVPRAEWALARSRLSLFRSAEKVGKPRNEFKDSARTSSTTKEEA